MKNLSAGNYALAQQCRFWLRDEAKHVKEPTTDRMRFGNAVHRPIEQALLGNFPSEFKSFCDNEGLRGPSWPGKIQKRYDQWHAHAIAAGWLGILEPELSFAFNVTTGATRPLKGTGFRKWQDVDRTCEVTLTVDAFRPPGTDRPYVDVYDWKTGRVNAEKDVAQIRLCSLAMSRHFGIENAVGHVVYISDDDVHDLSGGVSLDEFDMLGDVGVLERIFRLEDSEPKPGVHCKSLYCAARAWCEKKRGV